MTDSQFVTFRRSTMIMPIALGFLLAFIAASPSLAVLCFGISPLFHASTVVLLLVLGAGIINTLFNSSNCFGLDGNMTPKLYSKYQSWERELSRYYRQAFVSQKLSDMVAKRLSADKVSQLIAKRIAADNEDLGYKTLTADLGSNELFVSLYLTSNGYVVAAPSKHVIAGIPLEEAAEKTVKCIYDFYDIKNLSCPSQYL
jgi:hypothetical protein